MKRYWITVTLLGLLSASPVYAQNEQNKKRERERVSENQSKEKTEKKSDRDDEKKSDRGKKQSSSASEDEIRLKYDDQKGSLKIDIDEEFRLRRDEKSRNGKPPIARDGEFELRYDTDRHDLKASGEGTVDVDRAANAMARWWQSWWEEEKSARRSRQEGAESGARHFVREHDEDDDGYLSQRELPAKHREDFKQVDNNDDGYLSRDEVRRYGDDLYGRQRSTAANSATSRNRSQAEDQDQTWSEWWSAWWSSEDRAEGDRQEMSMQGAREFVRRHDRNDDGVIMRSEMPDRMYDEFNRLDANDDRRLTASELASRAPKAEQARSSDERRSR